VLYDTPDRQLRAAPRFCAFAAMPASGSSPTSDCRHRPAKHSTARIETETVDVAVRDALMRRMPSLLASTLRLPLREKLRAAWTDGEGHCVVDGDPHRRLRPSSKAGRVDRSHRRPHQPDPAEYITLSYGRLFDLWREQHNSAVQDLTFAAVRPRGQGLKTAQPPSPPPHRRAKTSGKTGAIAGFPRVLLQVMWSGSRQLPYFPGH